MNIKFIIMGSDENAYGVSRIIYDKYKVKPLLLCSRILFPTKYSNILDIKIIDNEEYIGYIEIPSLELFLPITNGYSYNSLKKTPALFYGNLNKNLVICGHSYKAHFGDLYKLKQKDKIIFIDVNNNKYVYEVELIETLKSTDVKDMIESDFDLTLYTCTKDGKNRVTVRCNRV